MRKPNLISIFIIKLFEKLPNQLSDDYDIDQYQETRQLFKAALNAECVLWAKINIIFERASFPHHMLEIIKVGRRNKLIFNIYDLHNNLNANNKIVNPNFNPTYSASFFKNRMTRKWGVLTDIDRYHDYTEYN